MLGSLQSSHAFHHQYQGWYLHHDFSVVNSLLVMPTAVCKQASKQAERHESKQAGRKAQKQASKQASRKAWQQANTFAGAGRRGRGGGWNSATAIGSVPGLHVICHLLQA